MTPSHARGPEIDSDQFGEVEVDRSVVDGFLIVDACVQPDTSPLFMSQKASQKASPPLGIKRHQNSLDVTRWYERLYEVGDDGLEPPTSTV